MCRRSHACGAALHELLFRSETPACLLELWAHGLPRELALVVSQTTNCCALGDTRKKGVPPRQETEHLAIAEVRHTMGDLFRSHRGRGAPEGSAAPLDAEIEKMGEPDFPDDDVMSCLSGKSPMKWQKCLWAATVQLVSGRGRTARRTSCTDAVAALDGHKAHLWLWFARFARTQRLSRLPTRNKKSEIQLELSSSSSQSPCSWGYKLCDSVYCGGALIYNRNAACSRQVRMGLENIENDCLWGIFDKVKTSQGCKVGCRHNFNFTAERKI